MFRRSITLSLVLSGWMVSGAEKIFDFREDKLNEAPRGFQATVAGTGAAGEWKVIQDEVASLMAPVTPRAQPLGRRPVLAQLSRDRADEHFPMLVYQDEAFGDFTVTTRFKIVDGASEQMAGMAFRLQDEGNYYYVRASALGNTFGLFKVIRGQRQPPLIKNVTIPKGVWLQMTIECKGTRIRALLNGQEIIPSYDDQSEAFLSGKLGYWTKSDSVSYFADTIVTYKPREILAQALVREALSRFPRLLGLKVYVPSPESGVMKVAASLDPAEIGQAAPPEVRDVLEKQGYFYGRDSGTVMLTLPLRDNNGDKVAAVRVVMKRFPGQTERNAVARALPVVHGMETRIQTLKDLVQ